MEIQIGRPNAQPWHPHAPPDATDIVVQVTDILYEYLPPDSGIEPEVAVQRVQEVVDSDAGMAAWLAAATHANEAGPEDIVARLVEVLDAPAPDPRELVSRLLEVVETPLAIEIYDREMERRQPRDVGRWH